MNSDRLGLDNKRYYDSETVWHLENIVPTVVRAYEQSGTVKFNIKDRGQSSSIAGGVFAFYVADPCLIPGISYGPPSLKPARNSF